MTENERVRQIRKSEKLTLDRFGEKIGMKKSSISDIENGRRALTEQARLLICREFNVSENWLRTGKGDMRINSDVFSLDEYAKACGASELEINIAKAYFALPQKIRAEMLGKLKKLLNSAADYPELESDFISASEKSKEARLSIDEEVEAYRRELEAEEKGTTSYRSEKSGSA